MAASSPSKGRLDESKSPTTSCDPVPKISCVKENRNYKTLTNHERLLCLITREEVHWLLVVLFSVENWSEVIEGFECSTDIFVAKLRNSEFVYQLDE